jgi:hypothetical protein
MATAVEIPALPLRTRATPLLKKSAAVSTTPTFARRPRQSLIQGDAIFFRQTLCRFLDRGREFYLRKSIGGLIGTRQIQPPGLKPVAFWAIHAAMKRRSSTVLHTFSILSGSWTARLEAVPFQNKGRKSFRRRCR